MKGIFRKLLLLITAGLFFVSAAGCQAAGKTGSETLYRQGLEVISLMDTLAADETYISLIAAGGAVREILAAKCGRKHGAPRSVYEVDVPDPLLAAMPENPIGVIGMEKWQSGRLRDYLKAEMHSVLPMHINAMGGAHVLAAANVCTAQEAFIDEKLRECVSYLYIYKNAVPAFVTFIPGKNGAAIACGTFIFNESWLKDGGIEKIFAGLHADAVKTDVR